MTATDERLNALVAVEADPVRRWERLSELRLWAAVALAPTLVACEALLAGLPVSVHRLDAAWVRRLEARANVVLDDELALLVAGHGPLSEEGRRAS